MAKILMFDIEATNLAANFGYMICIGWKWYGEKKVHIKSVLDFPKTFKDRRTNDLEVTKVAFDLIAEADMCVYHYGMFFDRQYIQTKSILHGLGPLAPASFMDTWQVAKKHLRLNSNRLATIVDFLGIHKKTPLSGPIWIDATAGDKKSIKYVNEHCYHDVLALEETYIKTRGMSLDHPSVALMNGVLNGCNNCGAPFEMLERRGHRTTHANRYERYRCKRCGCWPTGKSIKPKGSFIK